MYCSAVLMYGSPAAPTFGHRQQTSGLPTGVRQGLEYVHQTILMRTNPDKIIVEVFRFPTSGDAVRHVSPPLGAQGRRGRSAPGVLGAGEASGRVWAVLGASRRRVPVRCQQLGERLGQFGALHGAVWVDEKLSEKPWLICRFTNSGAVS